jgi:GMP synthase-like glutamine amidotransferase
MKPVLAFRHIACEGPGYLSDYLAGRGVAVRLVCIDQGDPIPESPEGAAGLAFMGGPMSVNDPLGWIQQELALIRRAAEAGIPLLGHCLGAQLIARALGATVGPNPVREIGWWPVDTVPGPGAQTWLAGLPGRFEVFHWHGETFSLPPGAVQLARNGHCEQQAFAIGNALGLQFHVEVTAPMVEEWVGLYAADLDSSSPAVQAPATIRERLEERALAMRAVADHLYGQWTARLRP